MKLKKIGFYVLVVLLLICIIPCIASGAKFNIGDNVRVTTNLNVRTCAGTTNCPEITDPDYIGAGGYAPIGTSGIVLNGPTSANGYIWWNINYGPNLYSGWSVESGLEKVTSCTHTCGGINLLSNDQLATLVRNHFPLGGTQNGESIRVTAYAVSKAESNGNPSACGDNDKSIGLWQINTVAHPEYDVCRLFEEDYNANAAREISNNGINWNPWCTYGTTCVCNPCTGTYQNFITEARTYFYPKVTSPLSVSDASINLGQSIQVFYSVSDDVGLNRVELWRATDNNGIPVEPWIKVASTSISGISYSSYLTDVPNLPGTYWYGIHVVDNSGALEAWNDERNSRTGGNPGIYGPIMVSVTTSNNPPPNTPSIPSGQSEGNVGIQYSYSTSTTDPNGNQVKYTFDWGDGSTSDTGFVNSGMITSLSHSWSSVGTYSVRTKAINSNGASSGWSGFNIVTIINQNGGEPQGTSYTVATTGAVPYSTAFNSQRKLAITSDGYIHAVYHRKDSNGIFQIYHAKSSDEGKTWIEEPVTSGIYNQEYPAIAVDIQNNIHIVWRGYSSASPGIGQIRYTKLTTSGWGGILDLTHDAEWHQEYPAIAVDSHDYLHVVWKKTEFNAGSWCSEGCGPIYYMKYTGSWSAPVRIGISDQNNEINPSISIDSIDYINVAWNEGGYQNADCWHMASTFYTTSWQPIQSFQCYVGWPSTASNSNGILHLGSTAAPNYPSINVLHWTRTGSIWGNPETVYSSSTDLIAPSIALDKNDYLQIVWPDYGNIKYRQFTSSWQDTKTIISDGASSWPNLLWAWNPLINEKRMNIPQNGYAFLYTSGQEIKFYSGIGGTIPPQLKPTVTEITPNNGFNNGIIHVTISGSGFMEGATVKLTKLGTLGKIGMFPIVDSPNTIQCSFGLDAATSGNYDVIVTNPDGQFGTLLNGFSIKAWIPEKFDWRDYNGNWMTPVHTQDLWGACWAFATIGSSEAKYNIEQGQQKNLDLSEWDLHYQIQHGVDAGASPSSAYDVIQTSGIVDESCLKFDWENKILHDQAPDIPWGRCLDFSSHMWKINQHNSAIPSSIDDVKQKIRAEGPITVVIPWPTKDKPDAKHAIVLVGWNDAEKVWFFKNSWGKYYEDQGYGKIPYTGSEHSNIMTMDWSTGVHAMGGPI